MAAAYNYDFFNLKSYKYISFITIYTYLKYFFLTRNLSVVALPSF